MACGIHVVGNAKASNMQQIAPIFHSIPLIAECDAEISLTSNIIFSRSKTPAMLRLNKEWRKANQLSTSDIFQAIKNAKCLSSATMEEVLCKECSADMAHPSSIGIIMRKNEEQLHDSSTSKYETYRFNVIGRCTSSRKHMRLSSVCLAVIMTRGMALSPPFQLQARDFGKKKRMRALDLVATSTEDQNKLMRQTFTHESKYLSSQPTVMVTAVVLSEQLADVAGFQMLGALKASFLQQPGAINICFYRVYPEPGLFPNLTALPAGDKKLCLSISSYSNVRFAEQHKALMAEQCQSPEVFLSNGPEFQLLLYSTITATFTSW